MPNISCSDALAALRRGELLPPDQVRALGEEQHAEFFREIVEPLADSFDPADADAYVRLMQLWIPAVPGASLAGEMPAIPKRVDTVYVLSRVTLGADIKITSIVLDAMKRRFPEAHVVLVGRRKSAELFALDARVEHLEATYPRSGPVSERIAFAGELRTQLNARDSIVVDPDSRLTQLGLIPVCAPDRYFHFPSRTLPGNAPADTTNLTSLTEQWVEEVFGVSGAAFIAPERVVNDTPGPRAAISLGVGGNDSKRVSGDFETELIQTLARRFATVWIDRGVGGEEASRVSAAAAASGCGEQIRFWEGSFAGFASIVAQSDLYVGYDSAGQHAAAAAATPLVTVFAGAPNRRFRKRWSPAGPGPIHIIDAATKTPAECLARISAMLNLGT